MSKDEIQDLFYRADELMNLASGIRQGEIDLSSIYQCERCLYPNESLCRVIRELEIRLKAAEDQCDIWKECVLDLKEELKPWHEKLFDRTLK